MAPKAAAPAAGKPKAKPAAKKAEPKEEKLDTPKVPEPDRTAYEAKIQGIQEAIEKFQKQQKALSEKINERSGGKEEFFAQKAEIRAQLDEFSAKLNELQARKDDLLKGVSESKEQAQQMRQQLNKTKKSIGYTSEHEIDDRIASIEFQLCTDTMVLKEEKKLLAEIQELKRNRPKVSQVKDMENSLVSFSQGASTKEAVSNINAEMYTYREGKRKVHEKLTELMEGRKAQLGDMPQYITERDEIGKQIQEKIKERNELREEFRAQEREFNGYLAELRKARQQKNSEERATREKEWQQQRLVREAEKLDDQPYVAEITLIEQTILFCKSLTASKGTDQKDEKKEIEHNNPEGTEVMVKKEDREEFYFVPTKAKKGKSNKKGAVKADGEAKAKPIKHNAETFRLFDQLKLDAPITTADIPEKLEKLEEQLASYQAKVKEWEEKKEEMKRRILEDGVLPGQEEKEKEKEKETEKEKEKEEEKEEEKAED